MDGIIIDKVRLDGTIRTEQDLVEVLINIVKIKRLLFASFVKKEEYKYSYESPLGDVECTVKKEFDSYSGYLKYKNRYYGLHSFDAKNMFGKILCYVIENV